MTIDTLARLIPPLCRLTCKQDVRAALDAVTQESSDTASLVRSMQAHPADMRPVLSAMTALDTSTLAMLPAGADGPLLAQCLKEGLLPLMHVCAQCTPSELLAVLSRCTFAPEAEALALLVSQHRQENARVLYGLQLLWRSLGDERIPDAFALFDTPAARTPDEVRARLLRRMGKEAAHD